MVYLVAVVHACGRVDQMRQELFDVRLHMKRDSAPWDAVSSGDGLLVQLARSLPYEALISTKHVDEIIDLPGIENPNLYLTQTVERHEAAASNRSLARWSSQRYCKSRQVCPS